MIRTEIIELIVAIAPTILLLLGGQYFLNKYEILKKRKEANIDLDKSIKQEQYKSISTLYELFGNFMSAYRYINLPKGSSSLNKNDILSNVISMESKLEGLILKICNEFVDKSDDLAEIEIMLGNLRQSVQIWRESVANDNRLPFNISNQEDYVRFKSAFSKTSTFMANKINLNKPIDYLNNGEAEKLLYDIFDKKHERWKKGHFYIGG